MLDVFNHIKVKDKEYPFAFNINIIQIITQKYGKNGLEKLGESLQPTDGSIPNMELLIFLCKECINEGIDMENDPESPNYIKREITRSFITEKQAGRIISCAENFANHAMKAIKESNDTGKEKNLTTEQNQAIQQ